MKIAVIGAGIIGTTTAWELAADGHEVTVLERNGAAAEEASFAPAGLLAPGHTLPWSSPSLAAQLWRQLLQRDPERQLAWPLPLRELPWLWRAWRGNTPAARQQQRSQLQRWASYSKQRLQQLSTELQLDYERHEGVLVLLRSETDAHLAQAGLQWLKDAQLVHQTLSPQQARQIEPALNPDTAFHAAIHLPNDEIGNCRQFALMLKSHAQQRGVRFVFHAPVTRLDSQQPGRLWLAHEARDFDAIVLCAGTGSAALLRPLGLKLPLATVYSCSVSAPLREPLNAPRSAILDERHQTSISRLGQRVRVAGGAQLGGRGGAPSQRALARLYRALHDWFPGAAQLSNGVQVWQGAAARLPDGPPLLGPSGRNKLWLNLGHGASAWAFCCASARVVADQIAGRDPDLDAAAWSLAQRLF